MRQIAEPTFHHRCIPEFQTANCGLLVLGDEFEFQPNDIEGASWKVFTFRGLMVAPGGTESISCYGGDPIKKDHEHDRAWRAFEVERVRAGARPVRANWRTKR